MTGDRPILRRPPEQAHAVSRARARAATPGGRTASWRPRLSHRTTRLFVCTFVIALVAKGAAFQQAFGFDDWGLALHPTLAGALLWQARIGGAWLTRLLEALSLESVHSQFVWVAIFIAVQALFATLVARHWRLERDPWLAAPAAALVAIHPYTCDSLHMRSAIAVAAVSQGLTALLLVARRWSPRRLVGGAVLFAVILSIYQLMLHYLLMVALVGGAVAWGRYLRFAGEHGWSERVCRIVTWRRVLGHPSTALGICALGGTALYAVAARLYLSQLHLELTARTQLLEVGGLGERARQVAATLSAMLLGREPLITRVGQWILLALLGIAIVGLLRWLRMGAVVRSVAAAGAALGGLGASLIWSFGLTLVIQEFWPAPRIVAPIAIFWAGAFALAGLLNGRLVRALSFAGAGILLFSFVGMDNRIFSEQVRLNQRDRLAANRIVERLELEPGFSTGMALAIHGQRWSFPLALRTASFDLNISAFGAAWSKAELLREITGYNFAVASAAQVAAAAEYCRGSAVYPAPSSVVVRNGLAVVCLEN